MIGSYDDADRGPTSAMAICAQLREEILRDFDDGQLVGSEDDLVARFDVSRPTMRQAVRVLQAEGLMVVRRGPNGGMFAKVPSSEMVARSLTMLLRHRGATFVQLIDALMPLSEAVVRDALTAEPSRRAAAASSVLDYEPPSSLDERDRILAAAYQFGRAIEGLTSNPVLVVLCEALMDLALNGARNLPPVVGHYEEARAFHCDVARAIRDGDTDSAGRLSQAMRGQLLAWMDRDA